MLSSMQLSIDIGDEVKGQNRFLRKMVSPSLVNRNFIHVHVYSLSLSFPLLPLPPSLPPFFQDEEFDSAGGFLASSMQRVKNMGKQGHNRWMCYMLLFIVIVFFVCYYIIKWRN